MFIYQKTLFAGAEDDFYNYDLEKLLHFVNVSESHEMVSAKVVEETQVVVEEEVVQNQSTSFDIDIKAAEAKIGVSVLMDDSIDGKGESRRVVLYSLELF